MMVPYNIQSVFFPCLMPNIPCPQILSPRPNLLPLPRAHCPEPLPLFRATTMLRAPTVIRAPYPCSGPLALFRALSPVQTPYSCSELFTPGQSPNPMSRASTHVQSPYPCPEPLPFRE